MPTLLRRFSAFPFCSWGYKGLCTVKRFRSKVGLEANVVKGIFGCLLAIKGDKCIPSISGVEGAGNTL
jgi:hypothetical protein